MACPCCQGAVDKARRARLQHFREARAKLNQQFALSVTEPENDVSDTESAEAAFRKACDAGVLMTEPEMQTLLTVAVRPQGRSRLQCSADALTPKGFDRRPRFSGGRPLAKNHANDSGTANSLRLTDSCRCL